MKLSALNRELLERKFGRALPEDDRKVTLPISAIAKLLDAARKQVRSEKADPDLQAMLDAIFGKPR